MYIRMMEKNMETAIVSYIGIIGYMLENGKENGNCYTPPN